MKFYFKVLGWFIILDWFVALIMFSIYMVTNFTKYDSSGQGLLVISLIAIIVLGPAMGILFISHSNLKRNVEDLHKEIATCNKKIDSERDQRVRRNADIEYKLDELKRNAENK